MEVQTSEMTEYDQTQPRQRLSARAEDAQGHALTLSAKLKATVRRANDNRPVAGLLIRFKYNKLGSDVGSAVTNTEGVAEYNTGTLLNLFGDAGSLLFGYDAIFDGDAAYEPFTTHANVHFGLL